MKGYGLWKLAVEMAIIAFAAWAFDWKVAVLSFLWLWLMNVRDELAKEKR